MKTLENIIDRDVISEFYRGKTLAQFDFFSIASSKGATAKWRP